MGAWLSCLPAGDTKPVAEALTTVDVSVGVRPCFFWMCAERAALIPAAERSACMLALDKNECQDATLVEQLPTGATDTTLVGVFDGHGVHGCKAANFAVERLAKALARDRRLRPGASDKQHLKALTAVCEQVDCAMQSERGCDFDATLSGTTAVVAAVQGMRLFVANVGDSRAVLAQRAPDGALTALPLTQDAKPDDPQERARIEAAGGRVSPLIGPDGGTMGPPRVWSNDPAKPSPGLAMSRSLGDVYAHRVGVVGTPEVSAWDLDENDQFVVLASDGVWEVMDNEEVVSFVGRYLQCAWPGWSAADALTLEAQERWKLLQPEIMVDDVAAVVILLKPAPPPSRTHRPPAVAHRAGTSNAGANSLDLMAARDEIALLPRQDFFKYLDAVAARVPEAASKQGPPGPGNDRSDGSGGDTMAAVQRSLSRTTILPGPPPDAASPNNSCAGEHGAGGAHNKQANSSPPASVLGGMQERRSKPALPVNPFARVGVSAYSSPPATPERPMLQPASAFALPPAGPHEGHAPAATQRGGGMSRAHSTPGPEGHKLRMAALSIPEHESVAALRTRSETSQALFRPFRKAYPSGELSSCEDGVSSSIGSPRNSSNHKLRGGEEGRVRGGIPRAASTPDARLFSASSCRAISCSSLTLSPFPPSPNGMWSPPMSFHADTQELLPWHDNVFQSPFGGLNSTSGAMTEAVLLSLDASKPMHVPAGKPWTRQASHSAPTTLSPFTDSEDRSSCSSNVKTVPDGDECPPSHLGLRHSGDSTAMSPVGHQAGPTDGDFNKGAAPLPPKVMDSAASLRGASSSCTEIVLCGSRAGDLAPRCGLDHCQHSLHSSNLSAASTLAGSS